MPIHTIAHYRVRPSGVDKVKQAIAEFVPHVRAHEPGTRLYLAWQQKDDPTRFVHFFMFEDAKAHEAHGNSAAVKKFEAAYGPELVEGDVVFTDYEVIADIRKMSRFARPISRRIGSGAPAFRGEKVSCRTKRD